MDDNDLKGINVHFCKKGFYCFLSDFFLVLWVIDCGMCDVTKAFENSLWSDACIKIDYKLTLDLFLLQVGWRDGKVTQKQNMYSLKSN